MVKSLDGLDQSLGQTCPTLGFSLGLVGLAIFKRFRMNRAILDEC